MFEIAYIISAPIIGMTLKTVGRKNYIVIGYLIIVAGTVGTSFLPYIESSYLFKINSLELLLLYWQSYSDFCKGMVIHV